MARSFLMSACVLAALAAGLVSCDSKKGEEVAGGSEWEPGGPSPTSQSVVLGKWENRYVQTTEIETRSFDWQGSGQFLECYGEARTDSSGKILATGSVCDTGTWSDLGTIPSIYSGISRWYPQWGSDDTRLSSSRMVKIQRRHGNTTPPRHFAGVDGYTMCRKLDTLTFTGRFFVYTGDGNGRLDSTLWVRPGAKVDSLYLDALGKARAKIDGSTKVEGTWKDSLGILIAEFVWKDPLGMHQSSRLEGVIGLEGNSLILFDLVDPVGFHKLVQR